MFEKIRPIYDRVLIKKIDVEEKTAGGITLTTDSENKTTLTGIVISVGQGHRVDQGSLIPLKVSIGDTVLLPKHAGIDIGQDHIIVREQEILSIVG